MCYNRSAKRIVLSTFGSLGDVNPYVAIALELKARGHQPLIATTPVYREKIEALGIAFHPVRPELPSHDQPEVLAPLIERLMHSKRGGVEILGRLILPYLREIYEDLSAAVLGADLLVTHPLPLVGPIVAEACRVSWLSSVLSPFSLFSAFDPPVGPRMRSLHRVLRLHPQVGGLFVWLAKRLTASLVRPVYRLRADLGLPPGTHPLVEGQHSPAGVLALFSPVLATAQPDWPARTHVTGFPFHDLRGRPADAVGLPSALQRFLAAGPAPIVFTLGSSAVWVAEDFFEQSVAAARALGQRALLLVGDGWPSELLSEGVAYFDYAPYGRLLPHTRLVVHHGGIGTTAQALRAGRPMLVVPFAHDQFDNAARIARLGTGRTLARSSYRVPRIVAELTRLIEDPGYEERAGRIGDQVQREDGSAIACDLIERYLVAR
jgi:UDP:flavonoid glycosyltransferase YjiC (YdhE family)